MIPEIRQSAESAIDYFHQEERGKPAIFWKSERLEIDGNSIYSAQGFLLWCKPIVNQTLLILPNSGISNSLNPPLSPHTMLYLLGVPHKWMADDRFIALYKS